MKDNGIDYLYADAMHPNTSFPEAVPIASGSSILQMP